MLNKIELPPLRTTLARAMPGETNAGLPHQRIKTAGCPSGHSAGLVSAHHGSGARADAIITPAPGTVRLHQCGGRVRVPRPLSGRLRLWKDLLAPRLEDGCRALLETNP